MELRPFQRRFIRNAIKPGIDTACLSIPRGNGKSALAGWLVTRILTPDDELFHAGTESVLCAASIEQARIVFRFARAALEPTGKYKFLDSHTRIGIRHLATNTRLRVLGSNGKTAMGLVGCPWAVCDEPGAWETNGGTLLFDAIQTAMGKPGSPLRALYIGTLAPSRAGWWHDLIQDGSSGSVYVQSLQGDLDKWDDWREIKRCNPLTAISPEFRSKLRQERDKARADERLKARFLSYRLNLPTGDSSTMLMTVADWHLVTARPVPERQGAPIVAVDLGQERAWSAIVALWPATGRVEAHAIAPGLPSIEAQETRDKVPAGTYQRLLEAGTLTTDGTLRVPRVSTIVRRIFASYGTPAVIVGDRARYPELLDSVAGRVPCVSRVTRWFEAAADIRATRRMARDGPLSVAAESRPLLEASLSAATVRSDDQGNTRLIKRSTNNTARDDVAAALVLAAGLMDRMPSKPAKSRHYVCGRS